MIERSDEPDSVEENIRNRDLLMDLVSVAQSVGHLPDEKDIEEHSEFSPDQYRSEFGDLFQACEEAGFVPDDVSKSDYEASIETRRAAQDEEAEDDEGEDAEVEDSEPSDAELIEELQWVDEMVDKIPYPSDMNDEGAFAAHTYQERFESWDQALDAAGIDKEQKLLEDMQRVADEVGEDMKQEDMNEYGLYSSSMAARFFGSWSEAKERFQEWSAGQDEEEEDSSEEFDEMVNDRLDDILG